MPSDYSPLRVASWNVKTLGKQYHHKHESVIHFVALVLLWTKADVIALMEVMAGFGIKHAVDIVEAMNHMSRRRWRIRFPKEYTGPGGHNGMETYAVIYDPTRFELLEFELVGEEIAYSRDAKGRRRLDEHSETATRRPAQAVLRPLRSNPHFKVYPEFRVVIFHAPSVAAHDYELACHAIGELGKLPVFADAAAFPYTVLCADLNIDEEAGNHVAPREERDFEDLIVKPKELVALDREAYERAQRNYETAVRKLEAFDVELKEAASQHEAAALLLESVVRLRDYEAEYARIARGKSKKKNEQLQAIERERLKFSEQMTASILLTFRNPELRARMAGLQRARDKLERNVTIAARRLKRAFNAVKSDLPTQEEAVLEATEEAFAPLAESEMFSNLTYSPSFRTTLRMSIHQVCTRQRGAKTYDEEILLDNFVYSNFDQVLVRHVDGSAWGDISTRVLNLMGAVTPLGNRKTLGLGMHPMSTPSRPIDVPDLWLRLLARAYGGDHSLYQELVSAFGEDLDRVDPHGIELDLSEESDDPMCLESGPAYDCDPLPWKYLEPFLREREVMAACLVVAFKRFIRMNNSDPEIEDVRNAARAAAATSSPMGTFLQSDAWDGRVYRDTWRYVPNGRGPRLFKLNVFLAFANVLSDHLPVVVEIAVDEPTKDLPLRLYRETPSIWSGPSSSAFKLVQSCHEKHRQEPRVCENIVRCCGTCDERTSVKTSDGCLTGWRLVRAAQEVCGKLVQNPKKPVGASMTKTELRIIGGSGWPATAGHLLFVKKRSDSFATDWKTEWFWKHDSVLVGRSRIPVRRVLCSVKKELAARKHPRILFGTTDDSDWSYGKIAEVLGTVDGPDLAEALLDFVTTGVPPDANEASQRVYAAVLVTLLGVEANKDNTSYLTVLLLLHGLKDGHYSAAEIFRDVDMTNECNLAGSLGLFPLASSDRSNFYGKRRCLTGRAEDEEDEWGEADVMHAMLNARPRNADNVILKKEMVVLADHVRRRFPLHRLCTKADLLRYVTEAWAELLAMHYGSDWA